VCQCVCDAVRDTRASYWIVRVGLERSCTVPSGSVRICPLVLGDVADRLPGRLGYASTSGRRQAPTFAVRTGTGPKFRWIHTLILSAGVGDRGVFDTSAEVNRSPRTLRCRKMACCRLSAMRAADDSWNSRASTASSVVHLHMPATSSHGAKPRRRKVLQVSVAEWLARLTAG